MENIDQLIQELFADKEKFTTFLKSFLSKGTVPSEFKMSQDNEKRFTDAFMEALNTPNGRQYFNDVARDKQTERFVKRNKPFFDAMLAGSDIFTSLSQIRQSNKAIRELKRPSMPSPEVLDPAINNAISQAQQGNLEALRALEPAKAEIAQAKLADLQTARSVSGGQAGAYSSAATAGNLRAMRAADRLPMLTDQIRARQQQRMDNLIGLRQNVRQNEFQNRMGIARENMAQYQADVAAAGALGQAGRTNLRMTLGQLPDMLTRTAGNMLPVQDVWSNYGASVEQNLANSIAETNRVRAIQPNVAPTHIPGSTPVQLNNLQPNDIYSWNGMPSYKSAPPPIGEARTPTMQRETFYDSRPIGLPAGQFTRQSAREFLMNPNNSSNKALRNRAIRTFYGRNN